MNLKKYTNDIWIKNIQGLFTSDLTIEDIDKEDDFEEHYTIKQNTKILNLLGFYGPQDDVKFYKWLISNLNQHNYYKWYYDLYYSREI